MFTIGRLIRAKIFPTLAPSKPHSEKSSAVSFPASTHKALWDIALIGLFMGLIALPGAGWLLGLSEPFDPAIELREPAPKPVVRIKKIGPVGLPSLQIFKGIKSYFDDRYFLRLDATHAFLWCRLHGLSTVSEEIQVTKLGDREPRNASSAPRVVLGKDGWLFYTGEKSLTGYRRADPLDFERLETIRERFEVIQQQLHALGIDYILVFAPNKGTIYPEYLPDYITHAEGPSRLDQVIEHFKRYSTVRIVDLRPALWEAKKSHQLYSKTDTHWNHVGSQVACRVLLEAIQHPDAAKETLEAYTFSKGPRDGDERNMLRQLVPIEEMTVLTPRQPRMNTLRHIDPRVWTTTGQNESINPTAPGSKVYVAHDSFFVAHLGEFFFEHFQQVRCGAKCPLPMEELQAFKPDFVLQEFVERKLNEW